MINTIDTKVNQVEAPNQEQTQNRQYVSMRGNDYERTPDSDTYESSNKNNTGKKIGIATALLAIGATIYAGCHGKNILEKAGKETGFMENIKTGYKNFFKKAENAVVDAEKNVEKEVEKKVEEATEKKTEEVAEKKVEEATEKKTEEEPQNILKQMNEEANKMGGNNSYETEYGEIVIRDEIPVWQKGLKEKEAKEAEKNIPQIASELQDAKTNLKNFEDKLAKLKNEYAKYNNPNMVDVESIAKGNALNEQIKALEEKIEHTKSFIDKSRKNLADLNSRCSDDMDRLAQDVVDGKFKGKDGSASFDQELNKLVDMLGPEDRDKAMSGLRDDVSEIARMIEEDVAKSNGKAQKPSH